MLSTIKKGEIQMSPNQSTRFDPEDKERIVGLIQESFLALVKKGLNDKKAIERVNKLKKAYRGLPADACADILIKRAKRKTMIEGSVNAAAITGCEASIATTGGLSTPAAVSGIVTLLLGDVTYTTGVQMQLVMDIAQLYECPYSKENEEDVWLIFKTALGLKGTERVGGYVRVVFYEAAKKQFRKLLRTGIRRGLQSRATKIAGKRVAKYLAEKYVMRLIPIANIVIGGYFNYRITGFVGKWTKRKAKIRSSTFKQLDILNKLKSTEKYLVLPLIFAVGTVDEKLTDNVLSLYVQSEDRLKLTKEQFRLVEELTDNEQLDDSLKSAFSTIQNGQVRSSLLDIAVTSAAVNIKTTGEHENYLKKIASWLGLNFKKKMLADKVKYLKR